MVLQGSTQDRGVERGVAQNSGHDRHAGEVRGASAGTRDPRMGGHEGDQLARVPQLSLGGVNGSGQAEAGSESDDGGTESWSDLHRLPQGNRASPAKISRRASRGAEEIGSRLLPLPAGARGAAANAAA